MLLLSTLGLGIANYLKNQRQQLSDSELKSGITSNSSLVSKTLARDIKQAVALKPSCDDTSGVAADCDQIVVRGGITPLPSLDRDGVSALNFYGVPGNIGDAPNTLADNDAVRILLFDFEEEFDCPLDIEEEDNPDPAVRSIYLDSTCQAAITNSNQGVGQLYIIVGLIGNTMYSNLFQVTGHNANVDNYEIQYSTQAGANDFNQTPNLSASGFPNGARIFPVKLVEYALHSDDNTLYRREISPQDGDMSGVGAWVAVQEDIENLQFWPLSIAANTGSVIEHQRSMQFSGITTPDDPGNDGIEDIRGISPRFVMRSGTEYSSEAIEIDNPITSAVESDGFDRKEVKFYVSLINFRE